ncbi:MAG: hypothetical protein IKA76_08700, partial [Clostridia bacterium]|nr:hypothetical protein [Clostridia bacterium]
MKKRVLIRWLSAAFVLILFLQSFLPGLSLSLKVNAASTVSVPTFAGGNLHRMVTLSNQNVGRYYTGATAAEFETYVHTTMVNAGFTVAQTNSIGNNRYATLYNSNGMAHVSYTASDGTMYIVTDPLVTTAMKVTEPSYTRITETTFSIFSLEYSHYTCAAGCDPKYDNNGMCYIITLEDGRYIILDGGYTQDAERLYNFLYDNNKREDGEIVIACWFLSHDHDDHRGCIQQFASTHGKDVILESVMANPTITDTSKYSGTWMTSTLPNLLPLFGGDADLIIPHTGQKFTFCNMNIEVFYTHEDLYHNNGSVGTNGNNASTVIQLEYADQTFMIPTDLMDAGCNRIVAMHGNNLKSDFFQIPHHGNSGCTIGFYEAVAPTYTLWTTSEPAFGKRTSGVTYPVGMPSSYTAALNKRIYTEVGADNCWYADGDVEIMQLPYSSNSKIDYYTPTDEVKDHSAKAAYSEDFSAYTAKSYTKSEIANLLGWTASGVLNGEICQITADRRLRLHVPTQNPTSSAANGELLFRLGDFSPFTKGRTVLEFDMEYKESEVSESASAPFRIVASNGNYIEPAISVNGSIDGEKLLKQSGAWKTVGASVSPEHIPYHSYSTDSMIFGSNDHYKIVIDPKNGMDISVNGRVVFSSNCDNAWEEDFYSSCVGEAVYLRVMPGIDLILDNIKIYKDEKIPELLITELAPNGSASWNEYIEVYNNSTEPINLYDYCIVRDPSVNTDANILYKASDIAYIRPGSTVYQPSGAAYTVTHTNPPYAEGILQPGEVALLWIATNTTYVGGAAGNGKTLADFRVSLGLKADQKAFVCYNNYNFSLDNDPSSFRYGIGYASIDYTACVEQAVGNLCSYVDHHTSAITDAFGDSYAATTYVGSYGSIRYTYPTRHGVLYRAEFNTHTAGTVELAQKRAFNVTVNGEKVPAHLGDVIDLSAYMSDPNATFGADMSVNGVTVHVTNPLFKPLSDADFWLDGTDHTAITTLYKQNFDDLEPGFYNTQGLTNLLGWESIKGTTGADYEITEHHRLRIRNPYTSGSNLEAVIGHYEDIKGNVVVLEYDFVYTNQNDSEGISNASFVLGHSIYSSGSCLQPTITTQGFQQTRIGTKMSKFLYDQVRPEWIPYTQKTTGYTYPHGTVTNHYHIFGGTNHVKAVIDPINGVMIYVNDHLISTPLDGKLWRSTNYSALIGSLFGICITPGMDVTWDNIHLYKTEAIRPELLITELGTSTGSAEFIELYNNSDRNLNIYDYCVVKNSDLTKVGTNWGNPKVFAQKHIATIMPGTHTYTAETTGQKVTLTNPENGSIGPGETAVLWIATNTTFTTSGSTPNGFTVEKFRSYHGLDDSVKVFACYNNTNFSLDNGGNIAYGIGYASENYIGRNAASLDDLICYVYANTTATSIYGNTIELSVFAKVGSTVEYGYGDGNMARQGRLIEAKETTNS